MSAQTPATHGSTWKNGDWCFYEYRLCQIVVEEGKVREASCGMFRTHGQDLSDSCRPLTLRNANLTQHTEYWSARLHKEGHAGLNHPDIHRRMVELWCAACDAKEGKPQEKAAEAIGAFAAAVLKQESGEVDGVQLIRRRYG